MIGPFSFGPRHNRFAKQIIMIACDLALLPIALWTSIGLRMDDWRFPGDYPWWVYLLPSLIAIPVFIRVGLYRSVIRHLEDKALIPIVYAVTITVWLFAGTVAAIFTLPIIPRGALLIYWMIAFLYIGASRLLARAALKHWSAPSDKRRNVLIYGAGESGRQIATALRSGHECHVVAFIDDNPELSKLEVSGIRVFNPIELRSLIQRHNIQQVILAIPHSTRQRRVEIINQLEPLRVQVRVMPGIGELVNGKTDTVEIREVSVDELLGRAPIAPNSDLLKKNITKKNVLVTGAGGSIGSELCRQVLSQNPAIIVLYELNEFALYTIASELHEIITKTGKTVQLHSILGSVQNRERIESIMRQFSVQTVFHTAAYKHVPIVEANISEGILNNTFGTLIAAEAAIASAVENFVLISTDKAVRPTNFMGASKRMAELILQALAQQPAVETCFSMVRFGNVLDSSGSVVPLFRRQIAAGGPVTVTHPEIVRYFMTIPEAAQLVIQAGAMSCAGQVFVLDMGEPARIADLARRMIHLSGHSVRDELNPKGEIEIRYTGLRPGEKLFEELLIGENVSETGHPRIMKAQELILPWSKLAPLLEHLHNACQENRLQDIHATLATCVTGFTSSALQQAHDHS